MLLRQLRGSTLIVVGLTTNSCILCTAHDANIREYEVLVPEDCCAARSMREHNGALEHIRTMASAKIPASSSLRLK